MVVVSTRGDGRLRSVGGRWRSASSREPRIQASIARCHFSHCLDSIADTTSLSRQTMRKVAPHTLWRYRSPMLSGPRARARARARRRKKKSPAKSGAFQQYFPAATYSPTPQRCSTIGPEGLSCRVRNGIGRFPPGMTTGKNSQPKPSIANQQTLKSKCVVKPHDRLVRVSSTCCHASTSRLSTRWSTWGLQGLAPGRPYLGVGFPLRCFQRLSFPSIATQLCHWRDNWCTRGSSIPVLSY